MNHHYNIYTLNPDKVSKLCDEMKTKVDCSEEKVWI